MSITTPSDASDIGTENRPTGSVLRFPPERVEVASIRPDRFAVTEPVSPATVRLLRRPDGGSRRQVLSRRAPQPAAFDIVEIAEPDRNVLVLTGELDRAAGDFLRGRHRLVATDRRPIILDCSNVSFVNSAGLTVLLELLERGPQDRLANIPATMARLFRMLERHDMLEGRVRHEVAIATLEDVDVVSAARVAEVFHAANLEGCSYDLVTLPFDATTCVVPHAGRRWHYAIVPPMEAWLGLSDALPIVRWARTLVSSSDQVIGIGTGLFLLAATGCLDGRRVAGGPHERILAAAAPRATLGALTSATDGAIETASDDDGAVALCLTAVGQDYGEAVRIQVETRLRTSRGGRGNRGRGREVSR
jgi:anti-anti-sigma regulatory factor